MLGDGKSGPKIETNRKDEARRSCASYFWRRDVGRGGSGWGFGACKFVDVRQARFALWKGAADLWATSSADLRFLVRLFGVFGFWFCGFVVLCLVSLGDCRLVQIAADRCRWLMISLDSFR